MSPLQVAASLGENEGSSLSRAAVAPAPTPRISPLATGLQPQSVAVATASNNRPGTTPGHHGVPFVDRKRAAKYVQLGDRKQAAKDDPSAWSKARSPPNADPSAPYPRQTAKSSMTCLRGNSICFGHAFTGPCRKRVRTCCPWIHGIISPAHYSQVSARRRVASLQRLAALTELVPGRTRHRIG